MLDDLNVIKQKDSKNALGVAASSPDQIAEKLELVNPPEGGEVAQIIVAGMGGSALSAGLIKDWLSFNVPFEIVRDYNLPGYVGPKTLVILDSYSGNTEETLSAYEQAVKADAQIMIVASGGKLLELAKKADHAFVQIPSGMQPRMTTIVTLKALLICLNARGFAEGKLDDLNKAQSFLKDSVSKWLPSVPTASNPAKKLALELLGKTPIIYSGPQTKALGYKWKISFNENAKNVAFCNTLPEFNHNEFIGWSSHPVEKPFGVIDLRSSFDSPRITQRFEISDRLLSGMRPKAKVVQLQGADLLSQLLWGVALAEFTSIYLAILNGVNPTPVDLIEKLKVELAK